MPVLVLIAILLYQAQLLGSPGEPTSSYSGSSTADALQSDADNVDSAPPAEEESTMVIVLETTKGDIELTVHREWAPIGADHFTDLVNAGFYDGAPWFRVIDGFVAQCGIAADPELNEQWSDRTILDEPVKQGNQAGYVAFGKTGMPNSRSTHIFINLADNSAGLDRQGFSCFAQVTSGMDVAEALSRCEYNDQGGLAASGGLERFKALFPTADYINRAYVK